MRGVGGLASYGGNLAIQSLLVAVMTYIITISIGKTFQRINNNAYKINGGQVSGMYVHVDPLHGVAGERNSAWFIPLPLFGVLRQNATTQA